jgi:hypothetical protein
MGRLASQVVLLVAGHLSQSTQAGGRGGTDIAANNEQQVK